MSFLWPDLLWLLLAVPLHSPREERTQRHRSRVLGRELQRRVDGFPRLREAARHVVCARETELRTAFRSAGVDALELATDDDLVDAILRFADLRKRRSRLAAGAVLPRTLP